MNENAKKPRSKLSSSKRRPKLLLPPLFRHPARARRRKPRPLRSPKRMYYLHTLRIRLLERRNVSVM